MDAFQIQLYMAFRRLNLQNIWSLLLTLTPKANFRALIKMKTNFNVKNFVHTIYYNVLDKGNVLAHILFSVYECGSNFPPYSRQFWDTYNSTKAATKNVSCTAVRLMHYKFEHFVFQRKMIYYTFTKWRSSTWYCFCFDSQKKNNNTKQSHPYGWNWNRSFFLSLSLFQSIHHNACDISFCFETKLEQTFQIVNIFLLFLFFFDMIFFSSYALFCHTCHVFMQTRRLSIEMFWKWFVLNPWIEPIYFLVCARVVTPFGNFGHNYSK